MGFDSSLARSSEPIEDVERDATDEPNEEIPDDGPSDVELNAQAVAASVAMDVQEMVSASKYARVDGTSRTAPEHRLTLGNSAALREALLGQPNLLDSPTWSSLSDVMALRGANSLLYGDMRTAEWLAQLLATRGLKARWTLHHPYRLYWLAWRVHAELRLLHDLTQIGVQHGGHCVVAGSYALHRLMLLELGVDPGFSPGDLDVFLSVPWASQDRAFASVHARLKDFFAAGPGVRHPVRSSYDKKERADVYLGQHRDVINLQASITRERVVEVINTLGLLPHAKPLDEIRRWGAAVQAQLPERFSLGRPYRLGRVIELGYGLGTELGGWRYRPAGLRHERVFGVGAARLVQLSGWSNMRRGGYPCPDISQPVIGLLGWTLPLRANIIEIVSMKPCDAMGVVASFDMEQCKVAMRCSAAGVEFVCSDVTRHCATHRLIRFCPMLLPACDELRRRGGDPNGELVPWFKREALEKMAERVRKYEKRGFRVEYESVICAIIRRRRVHTAGDLEQYDYQVEWHVVGPDGVRAESTDRWTSWETEAEVRRFETGRRLLDTFQP